MERRTTNDESKDRRNTTLTAHGAVARLTNQNNERALTDTSSINKAGKKFPNTNKTPHERRTSDHPTKDGERAGDTTTKSAL